MNIIKYLSDKVEYLRGKWYHGSYVVLDDRSNSVTISKSLYKGIMHDNRQNTDVFVFRRSDNGNYCFCMREDWKELLKSQTIFSQLQYNSKYHKIGFRTDRPSVTAIYDSYHLPFGRIVRLTCVKRTNINGEAYYEILPYINSDRK